MTLTNTTAALARACKLHALPLAAALLLPLAPSPARAQQQQQPVRPAPQPSAASKTAEDGAIKTVEASAVAPLSSLARADVDATPTPSPSPSPSPSSSPSLSSSPSPSSTPTPSPSSTPSSVAPVARKGSVVVPAEKAGPVRVPRLSGVPVIDGKIDEEVWKQAAVFKDFYQIGPGDNIAPTAPTEVFIGYDSRHLYVAFRAYDDPSKVRASVAARDNVFGEDNVRIYLDTFNDQRKAYVLGFNPLGVQQDGIHTEGGGVDYSVNVLMESKGALTSDGYVVEVAIPFKSLRYEAGKDKVWGIHLWRNIDRNSDEIDSWMPVSRDVSGTMNQAGKITGLEGISTERTLELIPSLTLSQNSRRVRSLPPIPSPDFGRMVNEPITLDPGLTAKFGVSPTMTLDLALNPDFAQVEADQLVVTTNQRFPIFFPERRPFFLEGIEIFQTLLPTVHTRAIVDPDAAVKLTGRRGRNTYGVILASDNGPGNITNDDRLNPNNAHLLDQNAAIGVARLKRDVGREHSLGLLLTSYNFTQKRNHLASVDGRFKLDPQTTLQFQLIGTHSRNFFRDPEFDTAACARRDLSDFELGRCAGQELYRTGNGLGYSAYLARVGRNFYGEFYGEGYTRDYRADVGFTSRTDTNFNSTNVGYNSTPKPKAKLVSFHAHNFTHIDYDFRGRMQIWESEFYWEGRFPLNSFFNVAYEYAYERLFEEEFGPVRLPARLDADGVTPLPARRGAFAGDDAERSSSKNHYFVRGGIRPSKKYAFNFAYIYRDGHFDLDFGAGRRYPRVSPGALAAREAQAAGLCAASPRPAVCSPALDPGPGGLTQITFGLTWQPTNELNNTFSYTRNQLRRYDTDLVAFDVNLLSWRTTYQFTRFLFARARVDYETLPQRARGQFLLGWTPNPGTAFYAGYNDDSQINGFSPLNGLPQQGFRRNGRTFFVKLSYLFRRSFGG